MDPEEHLLFPSVFSPARTYTDTTVQKGGKCSPTAPSDKGRINLESNLARVGCRLLCSLKPGPLSQPVISFYDARGTTHPKIIPLEWSSAFSRKGRDEGLRVVTTTCLTSPRSNTVGAHGKHLLRE